MRLTKQKHALNQALGKMDNFFNAEDLHAEVSKIGIATIYRYLTLAVKRGELHGYQCNNKAIYSTSKKNHSHFICEKCGSVKHIDVKKLDFLQEQMKGKICHVQIDVRGICEKCKKG
ncbi:hypothetical protein COV12_01055 [Candidatus Woesearchaeota archaeon CG10_big_fil_rev_8_21_14_0_10_32_24]|nr:MAG: hypothetical protein COV12_01055 [Candidatus Woesearchaeota archaeon CG10_big_fil_rev_8_21_14_0_10_32_24]